jgi:ribosome biogenesis ATPase
VVRKIADERSQYGDPESRLSFAFVYDEIKRSNSSLSRKPKKLLEDSIERVLETLEQDDEQDSPSDSINGEFDGMESSSSKRKNTASNSLNRSIVGAWANSSHNGSSTPGRGSSMPKQDQEQGRMEVSSRKDTRQANGEPLPKKRKAASGGAADRSPPTHVTLEDLGGVDHVVQQLKSVALPMTLPEIYASLKVQPARGVLIYGPPGCGKTAIANAFAAHLGVSFIPISAPSIVSGMSGESEKALREYFEEAKKLAPCLMFIDEIDAITPKREGAQREMEKRIVAQLLTCMDDLVLEKTNGKPVIVLAATNRPDSLDPALRRGGRFNKEINMRVPNEASRERILRALTRQSKVSEDVDYGVLARRTPGFVGADLEDLVLSASEVAMQRCLSMLEADAAAALPPMEMDVDPNNSTSDRPPTFSAVASLDRLIKYIKNTPHLHTSPPTILVSNDDFLSALPTIQPSALREGFATIPSTTFADIGALAHHRSSLDTTIIAPIADPKVFASIGIAPATGLLLWGPPGCGKTLLAKAVANESKANFISVKGPELLNKYVGESERAVRQVFARARSSVPVVIFFDEFDALVPHRADGGSMSEASSRVVNTMLAELDGVGDGRDGIYVIAATNRPHAIDTAMLRPGRLETALFVGLPDAEERVDILRTLVRKLPNFEYTPEIADIARQAEGFSGADLGSLLRKAGYNAVRRRTSSGIEYQDFVAARAEVRRSVGDEDLRRYEALKTRWTDVTML